VLVVRVAAGGAPFVGDAVVDGVAPAPGTDALGVVAAGADRLVVERLDGTTPPALPPPSPHPASSSAPAASASTRCLVARASPESHDGRPRPPTVSAVRRSQGLGCEPSIQSGARSLKFGIFYEHQLPRPWEADDEHRLLKDALAQIELADRLGFDYVWEVEHHFLEEYSHSSAPEVFLAAASQRTRRIRLGHGIVQLPFAFNATARVAERVATLDLISDGRVDFGTGESSSNIEMGGFGVSRESKRAEWTEALDAVTRMFVETPFAGYDGRFLKMPPRNVVPKPLQKPHPPLWVACSRRDTIHMAATKGIGALSFSFVEPEQAKDWVDDYYRTVLSEECVPGGFAINPNVAVTLPFMCHSDEEEAIRRGLDGGHFFGYSLGYYYVYGQHRPGQTSLWEQFHKNRSTFGFDRAVAAQTGQTLAAQMLEQGIGSLRGAIGTPDQIRDLLRRYEAAGVDQAIFVSQAGRNQHEHIMESLELFAREVMPEFHEHEAAHQAEKAERLAGVAERALARREAPRAVDPSYVVPSDPSWKGR
jgi:alkanesulfonate monooxygenase SsuD/methylene tetrahydromethanopterin reductase-like flavin-dependent oxidoreductase (luciferase family)